MNIKTEIKTQVAKTITGTVEITLTAKEAFILAKIMGGTVYSEACKSVNNPTKTLGLFNESEYISELEVNDFIDEVFKTIKASF